MGVKPEDIERAIADGNKVLAQLRLVCPTSEELADKIGEATTELRKTTDEEKLNKTERRFHEWLLHHPFKVPLLWTGVQCITLKLGHDCRYTPDFVAVNTWGRTIFYEVKGFWRDDARVKIKVAARQFPWAEFIAVQWFRGEWKFEEIKP